MASCMRLLAVVVTSGVVAISPSEKSPVRRQKDAATGNEVHCLFWGDTHPAGYRAGTTKLNAQLFSSPAKAEEFYNTSIKQGADIVMYYKGCPCTRDDEHSH